MRIQNCGKEGGAILSTYAFFFSKTNRPKSVRPHLHKIIRHAYTYPRSRWELRERGDVLGGHVTGQLEPIPTDPFHADLLPLSYVQCGVHTWAGHHWCSPRLGNASGLRRYVVIVSGVVAAAAAAAGPTSIRLSRASVWLLSSVRRMYTAATVVHHGLDAPTTALGERRRRPNRL